MSMALEEGQEKYTVYVGNLDKNVTEELLYELFIQAGPVEYVTKRKQWSYGFVKFEHEESVPYTVDLMSGISLFGRRIDLRPQKRSPRQSPERRPVECSPAGADHHSSSFSDKCRINQRSVHNHRRSSPKYHPYESEHRQISSGRPDYVRGGQNVYQQSVPLLYSGVKFPNVFQLPHSVPFGYADYSLFNSLIGSVPFNKM